MSSLIVQGLETEIMYLKDKIRQLEQDNPYVWPVIVHTPITMSSLYVWPVVVCTRGNHKTYQVNAICSSEVKALECMESLAKEILPGEVTGFVFVNKIYMNDTDALIYNDENIVASMDILTPEDKEYIESVERIMETGGPATYSIPYSGFETRNPDFLPNVKKTSQQIIDDDKEYRQIVEDIMTTGGPATYEIMPRGFEQRNPGVLPGSS